MWMVAYSEDRTIIVFNMTTYKPNCDESCVIEPGEHRYITRKSIIAYQYGRLLGPTATDALEKQGVYKQHDPISVELLLKIRQGAVASKQTPENLKKVLKTLF